MSNKNRDDKNRWRNKTIAFRVSPEENESINMRVKLSGLTKQEYISRRCQQQDIIVNGNPRIYKALKEQMGLVLSELNRINDGSQISDLLEETIVIIAKMLESISKTKCP